MTLPTVIFLSNLVAHICFCVVVAQRQQKDLMSEYFFFAIRPRLTWAIKWHSRVTLATFFLWSFYLIIGFLKSL